MRIVKVDNHVENHPERIMHETATIEMTCTIKLSIDIPTANFDSAKIRVQLTEPSPAWIHGVRLDKNRLAQTLGIESTKFLYVDGYQYTDVKTVMITKFDMDGKMIPDEYSRE